MTALLERPRTKSKGAAASIVGATLPQVNLLPPEVQSARGLRRVKRLLAFVLLGTLGLCALVWVYSLFEVKGAHDELTSTQDEATRIQKQLADPKYVEVPLVLTALAANQTALPMAMATDVDWSAYIDAIAAVLPEGASIDTFTVTYATPMSGAPDPTDPLQGPSLGQIAFSGRSVTVPDTAAWLTALNSVPGFQDAWLSSAAVTGDDQNGDFYAFSSTVQVSENALTHRFDPVDESAAADGAADDTTTGDGSATTDTTTEG